VRDAADHWQFSVADNGPGIDPRHHDRIFQLFQTLSPRDRKESTGVGLALVKKIVELYGGRVWVESKMGEGSTFFFTLPKAGMLTTTGESKP
jgi:signal transduction histidine kinase